MKAFGEPNDSVAWLELHFHPVWERWVVYQCLPHEKTNGFVLLPEQSGAPKLNVDRQLVDVQQWEIYRTRGVYASPYWVIQGSFGGHRRRMWPYEQTLAKMGGLPSELPYPGQLKYAEMDRRVMDHLGRLDQMAMYNKMLEYTDRNADTLDADEEQARVEILRKLSSFVHEQVAHHVSELSSADLSSYTNQLPSGLSRSVKGHDFEQWFEEQLLPRQRLRSL